MKALIQAVTCTSDHIKYAVVDVPADYAWEDDDDGWDFCLECSVQCYDAVGIYPDRCPDCGDTDVRIKFVEWCDCTDYAERRLAALDRAERRDRDVRNRMVKRVTTGASASDFVRDLCKAFPGLVDCETDVNGADLVDWITSNLSSK